MNFIISRNCLDKICCFRIISAESAETHPRYSHMNWEKPRRSSRDPNRIELSYLLKYTIIFLQGVIVHQNCIQSENDTCKIKKKNNSDQSIEQ